MYPFRTLSKSQPPKWPCSSTVQDQGACDSKVRQLGKGKATMTILWAASPCQGWRSSLITSSHLPQSAGGPSMHIHCTLCTCYP